MKTVALCASVAFYRHTIEIADKLTALGFTVILPTGAQKMKDTGNFEVSNSKTWFENPEDFHIKGDLMREHFANIEKSDLLVVVNDEKHGVKGYVGPNVVMEMCIGFYLNKPIYMLSDVDKDMSTYEEVMGMGSIFINGDLTRIPK